MVTAFEELSKDKVREIVAKRAAMGTLLRRGNSLAGG